MALLGDWAGGVRVGLRKTSTVDYPGRLAATLFFSGCNLRCPYCHNPELALGETPTEFLSLAEALAHLERRARVLSGVCLTGGEPLLRRELPDIVRHIRSLGLAVKIDTNGFEPERLSKCGADYVALDLKTAPSRYEELGARQGFPTVRRTMAYLRGGSVQSGTEYEYRTTVVPGLVGLAEARAIIEEISAGERWYLQPFRPDQVLDPAYAALPPSSEDEMRRMRDAAISRGIDCAIRV